MYRRVLLPSLYFSLCSPLLAGPVDPVPVEKEASPWEVTAAASLGLAQGNADTLTYALQGLATYERDRSSGLLGADLFYSKDNGTATTDSFRLFGNYNYDLAERFYIGVVGNFLTDSIADIDYRFDLASAFGYRLIKTDRVTFSLEAGPGYTWQQQGGVGDHFFTVRFGQKFEYQLSDRSKIWQSAMITPEASDFSNSLLIAEAGLDLLLTRRWALRSSVRFQYDSTPAAGQSGEDVLFLTGLRYVLGGIPEEAAAGRKTLKPDEAGPEDIKMGWTTAAALNFSMAQGNSDNLFVRLAYDSAYRSEPHETFLSAAYNYSQNDGNRSADSIRASAQHNRFMSERWFAGVTTGFFRDEVADVAYRVTPSVNLGYYFLKSDDVTLSFEAGPGYTFEEVGGVRDEFFTINPTEKFTWEISDRLTLGQTLAGIFDPSDTDNYIITASAFLDTDITQNIAWRISAAWTYDNTPAAGNSKDDSTLTTGLAVKF